MSLQSTKLKFREIVKNNKTDINKKLETCIKIKNIKCHLNERDDSADRYGDSNNKTHKFAQSILKFRARLRQFGNQTAYYKTQRAAFDAAMKYCLFVGQFLGVFPISNFEEKYAPKIRYPLTSWRYLHCHILCISQFLATVLCFYSLTLASSVTITKLAYFSFYSTTFVSSVLFMRLSAKWSYLIKQLSTAELDDYVNPRVVSKCKLATAVMLSLAMLEHSLSLIVKWTIGSECSLVSDGNNIFKRLILTNFYWLYDLNIPYSMVCGIYLMILNGIVTLNWSYLHLFVICMSLYLSSILIGISKVILSCEGKYLPPSYWRKLREDFNRASRLVRCFDCAINPIVFVSFASNLFFVCLQLYYILAEGVHVKQCSNFFNSEASSKYYDGILYGYENAIFATYSLLFVVLRSLAVAIIAADVHSASLVAATSLYSVPSPTYCTEVQRFIDQINGNTVALTGLNFFYVTKELILSIVGTIVTYELVLLQLGAIQQSYKIK